MKSLKILSFLLLIISPRLVKSQTITTDALGSTAYCTSSSPTIGFVIDGTFSGGNIFTAQLSDETGNFASPTDIGTLTLDGTFSSSSSQSITADLSSIATTGTQYRIRVVASAPSTTGTDNGTDLTVTVPSSFPSTDTSVVGTDEWRAYFFNDDDFKDYYGFYTIADESFNTKDDWNDNPTTSSSYVGCSATSNDNFTMLFKRQGFSCGDYSLYVNHDDAIEIYIDGVLEYTRGIVGINASPFLAWEGALDHTSEIIIKFTENAGNAAVVFSLERTSVITASVDTFYVCQGGTTYDIEADSKGRASSFTWSSTDGISYLDAAELTDSVVTYTSAGVDTNLYTVTMPCDGSSYTIKDSIYFISTVGSSTSIFNVGDTVEACIGEFTTIQVNGANDFSWTPTTNLTATSTDSNEVTVAPLIDTYYYVTGEIEGAGVGGCLSKRDSVFIEMRDLGKDTSEFGSDEWVGYFFDDNDFTNYFGFYTFDNESFDSRDDWVRNPTDASSYSGCTTTDHNNFTVLYKRKGFSCGEYNVYVKHDDGADLYIDGVLVYTATNAFLNGDSVLAWTGSLDHNTEISARLTEIGGGAGIQITFNRTSFITDPAIDTFFVCQGGVDYDLVANSGGIISSYSWDSPDGGNSYTAATAADSIITYTSPAGTDSSLYVVSMNCSGSSYVIKDSIVVVSILGSSTSIFNLTDTVETCAGEPINVLANGANDFSWTPTTNLTATSIDSADVTVSPIVDTYYIVTGTIEGSGVGGCLTKKDSVFIEIKDLGRDTSEFGSNEWVAYFFDDDSFINYYGYYTTSDIDFDTRDSWAQVLNPSSAAGYTGCTPEDNDDFSMLFKRKGFPCGVYQLDIDHVDDQMEIYIDDVLVYQRIGASSADVLNVWTDTLTSNSEITVKTVENSGAAISSIVLTRMSSIIQPSIDTFYVCQGGTSYDLVADSIGLASLFEWSSSDGIAYLGSSDINDSLVTYTSPMSSTDTNTYVMSLTCKGSGEIVQDSVVIVSTAGSNTEIFNVGDTVEACIGQETNILLSGANEYSWTPTTDLTATSTDSSDVTVAPLIDTYYVVTGTVEGSDVVGSCLVKKDSVFIEMISDVADTIDYGLGSSDEWRGYFFNGNASLTDYFGYYTFEGESFNTADHWAINRNPTVSTIGTYTGCSSDDYNSFRVLFKRKGFTCGNYNVNLTVDDNLIIYVDGSVVYSGGIGSSTQSIGWLSDTSEVSVDLWEGAGNAYVEFTLDEETTASLGGATWKGDVDTDWTDPLNWCESQLPNNTLDVYIPLGRVNYPVLQTNGSELQSMYIYGSLTTEEGSDLQVNSNWYNNGTFTANGGLIKFEGASLDSIAGTSSTTFDSLQINKANSTDSIILGNDVTINGDLILSSGKVYTKDSPGMLTVSSTGTTSNGSQNSFVNGPMVKEVNGTSGSFTFPIGEDTIGFISISGITSSSSFQAEYFRSPFSNVDSANVNAPIERVSQVEYWQLGRNSGTSDAFVTLNWADAPFSGINFVSNLRTGRYNGSTWDNAGQSSFSFGSTGSITTDVQSSFGTFTFATTSSSAVFNPLPVEFIYFNGSRDIDLNIVKLQWSTSSEENNNYFVIERSIDNITYDSIGVVYGSGNTSSSVEYSYSDSETSSHDIVYYKLKQVDYNGDSEYHDEILSFDNIDGMLTVFFTPSFSSYPNPFENELIIKCKGLTVGESVDLSLYNLYGNKVLIKSELVNTNEEFGVKLNTESIISGLYYLECVSGSHGNKFKIIKH